MLSSAEENYLKLIFKLEGDLEKPVPTGALAGAFGIQAPSVTEMLKKLADKGQVLYEKSKGVKLTATGKATAISIIRKHRIWESFLVETLKFGWDEVHILAEQLEHIHSEELINRLESFLGFPKYDPHGDPIPDIYGKITTPSAILLSQAEVGLSYKLMGIKEDAPAFLQFLNKIKLHLGSTLAIQSIEPFDQSVHIKLDGKTVHVFSYKVAALLNVVQIS